MKTFGGPWTIIKLEAVKKYLKFYCQALKSQPFNLIYIDVCTGSGKCQISRNSNINNINGSAKIALDTEPGSHEFYFIEKDISQFSDLEELKSFYPNKKINLHNNDANEVIFNICNKINWNENRAVIFVDPFGLEIKWSLIEEIAKTKAMDMWYFFSISGIYRQAANNFSKISKGKEKLLTEVLGTDEWKNDLYKQAAQGDFFSNGTSMERKAGTDDIVKYVKERLGEIFPAVTAPLLLPDVVNVRYALFFAVANPKAVALSIKVADYILNNAIEEVG